MDTVRSTTGGQSRPSPTCADATISAGASGASCASSLLVLAATAPTGWALLATTVAAAGSCGITSWNTAKAVDRCSTEGASPQGAAPPSGQDGVEDHRNDPADAPWRRQVVIQPIKPRVG
jgi:hypothetical protein